MLQKLFQFDEAMKPIMKHNVSSCFRKIKELLEQFEKVEPPERFFQMSRIEIQCQGNDVVFLISTLYSRL